MKLLAILGTASIAFVTYTIAAPKAHAKDLASIIAGAGPGQILLRKPVPGFMHPQAEAFFFLPETSEASDENPLEVQGAILRKDDEPVLLARFPYEGGVAGIVDAVLLPSAAEKSKNLGVIARWRVKHRGLGIDGEIYKVYVFKDQFRKVGGQPAAETNDSLMKIFGEGFEGMQEGGVPTTFKYKTAADLLAQTVYLTVPDAMIRLKVSRSLEERSRILADIGIPQDSLPVLMPALRTEKRPVRILRAEVFQEDLEGDGRKEGVSQVVMESGPGAAAEALNFLLLIHSDPLGKPHLRYAKSFGFRPCGKPSKTGLKFCFRKPAARKKSRMHLQITESASCSADATGLEVRIDTLFEQGGTYRYIMGRRAKP
ncbi:MAG TPA: hypothetical protein VK465_00575 [Fibrobacteria bacterium]|nr:hypothetical protein [Fibrobacteria bacterium]